MNLTIEQFNTIKLEIAKWSPKGYGAMIVARNQALLDRLEEMYEQYREGKEITSYGHMDLGCPHCNCLYFCKDCLWTRVVNNLVGDEFTPKWMSYICMQIPFNGYALGDVDKDNEGFTIEYGAGTCVVRYEPLFEDEEFEDEEFDEEEDQVKEEYAAKTSYERCKAFLTGHISWGSLDCWGEKYEEGVEYIGERNMGKLLDKPLIALDKPDRV